MTRRTCFAVSMVFLIAFSIVSSFSAVFAADPISPANNAVLTTLTPDLTWKADPNATKYDIWMLKKSKTMFGLYMLLGRSVREASAGTTMKLKSGTLEDGGDYLWMIRSVTAKASLSNFGKTYRFTTKNKQDTPVAQTQTPTATASSGNDLNTISGMINAIRQKFGITMENGTAQWALNALKMAYDAFSKLPAGFLNTARKIQLITSTPLGSGVLGYVNSGNPSQIFITSLALTYDLVGTIVHEMTHCFQFGGYASVMNAWSQQFWGARNSYNGQSQYLSAPPTDYGKTNAYEDMAESVRVYYASSASLKQRDPARYLFVKNNIMGGKEF